VTRRRLHAQHARLGYGGAVAAGGALSAAAGLDVLRRGGTAVDAVVAGAYVQGVIELPWGGIGGDAFVLVRTPSGEVRTLNGSGAAPVKLGTRLGEGETIPRFGAVSVGVPGFVAAVDALHQLGGALPMRDLIEPAAAYAADGFPLTREFAAAIGRVLPSLDADAGLRTLLEGNPAVAGARFRQLALADTLRSIGDGGAAHFYTDTGERLATWMAGRGGPMTPDDFASHSARWARPMSTTYRGRTIHTHPPVSLGCVLLYELGLYEQLDMPFGTVDDADRLDAMVRCKHVAFERVMAELRDADRRDPSDAVIAEVERNLLDPERIVADAQRLRSAPVDTLVSTRRTPAGTDTTCIVAADASGCVAAVIHSLFNEWGSRELDAATGVLLNDRLANQVYAADGNGGIAGGQRPIHTLNAVLVSEHDRPAMLLATPGGRGQVQTSFQVLVNTIDGGMDPQHAIDAPRWLSGAPRRPEPNDQLFIEPGVVGATVAELARRGHRIEHADGADADLFGSCVAVGELAGQARYAAADHRRDAHAASY